MKRQHKLIGLAAVIVVAIAGLVVVNLQSSRDTGSPGAAAPTSSARPNAQESSASPTPESVAPSAGETSGATGTLIVFFSRAGHNYGGLDLEVGNTAQIAQFIHERVGGDIYEIVPVEPYDETTELARAEFANDVFPEIAGELPDADQYDTVFLGYPIWYGAQPMIVQTFMRDRDLNHATVIPFITHEGSGFGNSLAILQHTTRRPRSWTGSPSAGTACTTTPRQRATASTSGWTGWASSDAKKAAVLEPGGGVPPAARAHAQLSVHRRRAHEVPHLSDAHSRATASFDAVDVDVRRLAVVVAGVVAAADEVLVGAAMAGDEVVEHARVAAAAVQRAGQVLEVLALAVAACLVGVRRACTPSKVSWVTSCSGCRGARRRAR